MGLGKIDFHPDTGHLMSIIAEIISFLVIRSINGPYKITAWLGTARIYRHAAFKTSKI